MVCKFASQAGAVSTLINIHHCCFSSYIPLLNFYSVRSMPADMNDFTGYGHLIIACKIIHIFKHGPNWIELHKGMHLEKQVWWMLLGVLTAPAWLANSHNRCYRKSLLCRRGRSPLWHEFLVAIHVHTEVTRLKHIQGNAPKVFSTWYFIIPCVILK